MRYPKIIIRTPGIIFVYVIINDNKAKTLPEIVIGIPKNTPSNSLILY